MIELVSLADVCSQKFLMQQSGSEHTVEKGAFCGLDINVQ